MSLKQISNVFAKQKAFVGYLTAGDGSIQRTLAAAYALIDGGVNILEIGMPFSDPVADGPIIQRAASRALAAGTTMKNIISLIKEIRKKSDIPLILFSYYNPLLHAFKHNLLQEAAAAGLDGVLVVDCPIEESSQFQDQCLRHDLAPIYVITSFTSLDRLKKINDHAKGFLYFACQKGTTGPKDSLPKDFVEKLNAVKAVSTLPIVVGFGISTQEMASEVLKHADGVVVGSLFVKALEEGATPKALTKIAKNLCPNSLLNPHS